LFLLAIGIVGLLGADAALAANIYIVNRASAVFLGPNRQSITDRRFHVGDRLEVDESCDDGFCRTTIGSESVYVPRSALKDWTFVGSTVLKPKKWFFHFS
jgi:hypothetical protein